LIFQELPDACPMQCEKLCFARLSDILHGNSPLFKVATSRFIAYQAYIFYLIWTKKAIPYGKLFRRKFPCFCSSFLVILHKIGLFLTYFRHFCRLSRTVFNNKNEFFRHFFDFFSFGAKKMLFPTDFHQNSYILLIYMR